MEIDVVALSADHRRILIGEAKWHDRMDWNRESLALRETAARFPLAEGRDVRLVLFAKQGPPKAKSIQGVTVITPKDVMSSLR
jgi:hypothetical protein